MTEPKTIVGHLFKAIGLFNWLDSLKQQWRSKTVLQKALFIVMIIQRFKLSLEDKKLSNLDFIIPLDSESSKTRQSLGSSLKSVALSKVADPESAVKNALILLEQRDDIERNKKYKQIATNMLLMDSTVSELAAGDIIENAYQQIKNDVPV